MIMSLPTTLLDLLSVSLIADGLLPYLDISSTTRLSRTARAYHLWTRNTPSVYKYLELSRCKGAYTPNIAKVDSGGHSWRAERMDENLTEDEFLAGPLRSVLNRLDRQRALRHIRTLVLDNLYSVTNDVLHEILTDAKYNVKLLSIRQCLNVNPKRLRQLLMYLCRPSRPEGTPCLQGLYFFTDPSRDYLGSREATSSSGVTMLDGATLGLLPTDKGQAQGDNESLWYSPCGRVISIGSEMRSDWEETMQACEGIISFDAVLCKAMHAHMQDCLHEASQEFLEKTKPGIPPMATIALGLDGCAGCGKAPDATPTWGQTEIREFPLLAPPPWSGRLIDATRPPSVRSDSTTSQHEPQRLIVSCRWCLVNRHCVSCQRFWCNSCYNPRQTKRLNDLRALELAMGYKPTPQDLTMAGSGGQQSEEDSIKVFNGFCIENCLVGELMSGAGGGGMWA